MGRQLRVAGGRGTGHGAKEAMLWYQGAGAVVLCTDVCCLPTLCAPCSNADLWNWCGKGRSWLALTG